MLTDKPLKPFSGNWKNVSRNIFIMGLEAETDFPEAEDPRFLFSVYKVYRLFWETAHDRIVELEKAGINPEKLKQSIFAEACHLLVVKRDQRQVFHTPIYRWRDVIETAGLRLLDEVTTLKDGQIPLGFVLKAGY